MNVRSSTRATSPGSDQREVGVRALGVGEALERPGVDELLAEPVVLLGRAVAPVDLVGLGRARRSPPPRPAASDSSVGAVVSVATKGRAPCGCGRRRRLVVQCETGGVTPARRSLKGIGPCPDGGAHKWFTDVGDYQIHSQLTRFRAQPSGNDVRAHRSTLGDVYVAAVHTEHPARARSCPRPIASLASASECRSASPAARSSRRRCARRSKADISGWPPAWAVSDRPAELWAVTGELAFPLAPTDTPGRWLALTCLTRRS